MSQQTLRFFRRGEIVTVDGVDSNRTLLDLLREDLHCSGTKEGCGEGDCGACTVVLGEERDGALHYSAVNSCIRLAHSIDGLALWTVEDLAGPHGQLHPVQEALVQCHGSQCGFCTPGFAMSLFALYQDAGSQPITRAQAQHALSGNLCRCTGYRPILDAACTMQALPLHQPHAQPDAQAVLAALHGLAASASARPGSGAGTTAAGSPVPGAASLPGYCAPRSLLPLLQARQADPQAQLVAGATDVGLWLTKQHRRFARLLDTTRVHELRLLEHGTQYLRIGAAVTLTDAFAALLQERPQLAGFASRFAGLPVRNAGTLGGNIANGSPIGDSMPLLIALGASVVLARADGDHIAQRELPLEALYTGYRTNCMAADEVLAWIHIPRPGATETLRAYKVSKRFEDDISAVCLAINLHIEDGVVRAASIGAGGVAATPARARATEDALRGQPWEPATVRRAMQALRGEFTPLSDMRASAGYRSEVLGNLLQRFWLESQGAQAVSLDIWPQQGVAA